MASVPNDNDCHEGRLADPTPLTLVPGSNASRGKARSPRPGLVEGDTKVRRHAVVVAEFAGAARRRAGEVRDSSGSATGTRMDRTHSTTCENWRVAFEGLTPLFDGLGHYRTFGMRLRKPERTLKETREE